MSARKPRQQKAKAAATVVTKDFAPAPVAAAAAAPAPAPVAVPVPTPAPVAAAPAPAKADKPVPEGHIDSHRVRKSIDQYINSTTLEQKAALQRDTKAYEGAVKSLAEGTVKEEVPGATEADPKQTVTRPLTEAEKAEYNRCVKTLGPGHAERLNRLSLLKSAKLRISPEVSTLIRYVLEQIIREGSGPALDTALAEQRKKATIAHFHTSKLSALKSYPLLLRSATYRNVEESLRVEREASERIAQITAQTKQAVIDFKKKHGVSVPRNKKAVAEPVAAAAAVAAVEEPEVAITKTPQAGSIDGLAKEIASKYPVKGMSLSGELRRHFGDIINDLLVDFSGIMLNLVTAAKNKTVTEAIAYNTLCLVFTQGFAPLNHVELVDGMVQDPAKLAEEKKKKEAAKAANKSYKIDYAAIPLVKGKVVSQTITFPGSNWTELHTNLVDHLQKEQARIEADKEAKRARKAAALKQ